MPPATQSPTIPPWAQPLASGWSRANEAITLTDMTAVAPADAVATRGVPGKWRAIPYEAGGMTGTLLSANTETNARPVRVALPVTGWHAIFVGLFSTVLTPCQVWLKLKNDPAALLRVSKPAGEFYWAIEEVFFKVAYLEGDAIEVAQQSAGYASSCGVAFVKAVPLSAPEAEAFQADRGQTDTRTMAATSDGYSYLWSYRPTTETELRRELERFRGTDYGTLLLHLGGADLVNYPSRVGRMFGEGLDDFVEVGQRYAAESCRELARKNINPTKVWIDAAHEQGMKVHIGTRPAMWSYYEPHTELFSSDFYRRHPEWRCFDRDGTPVTRMSWAVPEVRQYILSVLFEAVAFGADGAHVVFNRGFPMVAYEQPAVEIFRKQHGCDPRDLDESDPRIKRLWSDQITHFMREARVMLDAEEARRADGKHLELSVCVLGTEFDNMQYGLDVRRLVEEGLIDEVYIYCYDFGARDRRFDVSWFHEFCAPRGVRVVPMFSSPVFQDTTITQHIREGEGFYRDGADGISVWDPHMAATPYGSPVVSMGTWLSTCRLGHRDELGAMIDRGVPPANHLPVVRLGTTVMNGRFPPYWCG